MIIASTYRSTGRRRSSQWRLPLTLLLVAAAVLLGLPGAADAHVKAKHKAEYRAELANYTALFSQFERSFNNVGRDGLQSYIDDAADLLANQPDQQEALYSFEQQMRAIHDHLAKDTLPMGTTTDKLLRGFRGKASRYFASKADRSRFVSRVDRMRAGFRLLIPGAYGTITDGYLDLSEDPPDIIHAQQGHDLALGTAAFARSGFDAARTSLRQLL